MDDFDALDAGLAFAGAGLLLDNQTRRIEEALARAAGQAEEPYQAPPTVQIELVEQNPTAHNALDYVAEPMPADWDDYIGQAKVKKQMHTRILSAKRRGVRLPHILIASKRPGVGKTHLARLLGRAMGVETYELVPPFNIYTLVEAVLTMRDGDHVFVDELHKFRDTGRKGPEILLKILEEGVAFMPDGEAIRLPDVTYIGATTEVGLLPQTVRDRFKVKPYLDDYTKPDLARITIGFAARLGGLRALGQVTNQHALAISKACRGTPRICEEMVQACIDIAEGEGHVASVEEMLDFVETEPDGMTPMHIRYITALRTHFRRQTKKGVVEYMSGAPSLVTMVPADPEDLVVLETFLLDKGYIDKTPQGRRLTEAGIVRAEEYIALGKGITCGQI